MMRKMNIVVVLLILTSTFFLALTTLPRNVSASTLFVGGTGPGNHTTIQSAIDSANPGDTIQVFNGIYKEFPVVDKPLSLVGEDRNQTVIDGMGTGHVVSIVADWVNFTGFKVINNSGTDNSAINLYYANNCFVANNNVTLSAQLSIHLHYSDNNTVTNNHVWGNWAGIFVEYSKGNDITRNFVSSSTWYGIKMYGSDNNSVTDNFVYENRGGISIWFSSDNMIANNTVSSSSQIGVELSRSSNNTLAGNAFSSDGVRLSGDSLYHFNTHAIPKDNTVNGKPIHYYIDCNGFDIDGIPMGQLILANCTDVRAYNLHITDTDDGILIAYGSNITVMRSTISGGEFGIYLRYSPYATISGNNLSSNRDGIFTLGSDNATIMANVISFNSWHAIDLLSSGSTIAYNQISDNLSGIFASSTDNNRIYHNNVINNTEQGRDNTDTNQWDDGYPSGGNYWYDYAGVDQFSGPNQDQPGSDGIGDTPYGLVAGGDVDRYPLMSPATVPLQPTEPLNLLVTEGEGELTLSWNPPTSDGGFPISNYVIYRGTASGADEFLVEVGNVLTYGDTGLTNGQTYYYRVSAMNGVLEGPKSNEASATPVTIPTAPTELTSVAGNGEIILSWSPPIADGGSQITNYNIYRDTSPGPTTILQTLGNVLSHTDTGLTNSVTYYYQVAAVNGVGEGSHSNETNSTPMNKKPSCVIVSPSSGATISGTLTITGTASDPDGAVQYVEIRIDNDSWVQASGNTSWSYEWNTSASSNGAYTIFARSYDGEDYSNATNMTLTVDNPTTPPPEQEPDENGLWMAVVATTVIIVVVLVTTLILLRRRSKKTEVDSPPETEE